MSPISTRVLLVEDNPGDVYLLREALRDVPMCRVELFTAATLGAALQMLDAGKFDVALLDLRLPDAEGLAIVEAVRAAVPALPVVVLTGWDDFDLASTAVREGAQDYLVKGRVDGELLVRSMQYAIERKKSLDALARSEQHFRELIENSSDTISVFGMDGKLTFVSPSVERLLAYPAAALVGGSIVPYVHPDDLALVTKAFEAMCAGGSHSGTVECRLLHRDGMWRVFESTGRKVVKESTGASIVVNSRDITERKNDAETLRALNERLSTVIDNAPLAIIQVNMEGRVVGWSDGAERIFGWTKDEVVGLPLPVGENGLANAWIEPIRRSITGESLAQEDLRCSKKDGTDVDVKVWTAPLRDEAGKVNSVLGIVADVTEKKRLEEQFRHSQKMEAVGRLAGGVAHDFNNLLTVITGYSQLAAKHIGPDGPGSAELVEILSASDRAATLTKQLLTLSRRPVLEAVEVDLNSLVSGIERMLRKMIGEDVELVTRLTPSLPPIRADRAQIELVLLNLAVNARDAMPGGGIFKIETSLSDDPRLGGVNGSPVRMVISDTGTGMPESTQARIFEPFFTTKAVGKGTGLGLSTSHSIIRQHGGEIEVRSLLGSGTVFEIRFPASRGRAIAQAPAGIEVESPRGSETILLVEDEPEVAEVMRHVLAAKGYSVLVTSNTAEALSIARSHPGKIELLLSDVVLRGTRGPDLAREIVVLRPEIRLLFVSGHSDAVRAENPLFEGAGFLQKPFAPETLARKVREVLEQRIGGRS